MHCHSLNMWNRTICMYMHCVTGRLPTRWCFYRIFECYSMASVHTSSYLSISFKMHLPNRFFSLSLNVCNLKYNNGIEKSLYILAHYIIITNTFSKLYFSFYPLHRIECLLNTKIMLQFFSFVVFHLFILRCNEYMNTNVCTKCVLSVV